MQILAIDPGPEKSAWLIYDGESIRQCGIDHNHWVSRTFSKVYSWQEFVPVIEDIECFGMPVGRDVFHTVRWTGRFAESFGGAEYIGRREVKLHLCNSARAKDANVRQALIDCFPRTGGGKTPSVGTKSQPGPLYGVKSHLWSALAIAVTWCDRHRRR